MASSNKFWLCVLYCSVLQKSKDKVLKRHSSAAPGPQKLSAPPQSEGFLAAYFSPQMVTGSANPQPRPTPEPEECH